MIDNICYKGCTIIGGDRDRLNPDFRYFAIVWHDGTVSEHWVTLPSHRATIAEAKHKIDRKEKEAKP